MKTVTITTAGNLSEETFAFICENFRKKLGEVTFVQKTDPSLIGGFVADVNGQIYDMSISAQLAKMKSAIE